MHTPSQSSVAIPPQSPLQSISNKQMPLQLKFSSGYSQLSSLVFASGLKLQASLSVHPKIGSGATEFWEPGVPPGITKLACQLCGIELSKSAETNSKVEP